MFSKTVTNSSRFLMSSLTAQALYFHLGMNADDDGFVEHFTVMRMVEAKPDDLRVLAAKGLVKVFDDRVLVITDWKENNFLRNDRYTPSKYLEEYKDEIKEIASGIPLVYQRDTQVRLGKVREGNKDGESSEEFNEFWAAYPKKKKKPAALKAWKKQKPPIAEVLASLEKYKKTESWKKEGGQFIPHPASWLNDREWEDEVESPRQPIKADKPLQGFL